MATKQPDDVVMYMAQFSYRSTDNWIAFLPCENWYIT